MRNFLREHWCALGIGVLILATAPLAVVSRPVVTGSEAREAAIAKEMAEAGQFLSTQLAGGRMHEKPPFFYAAVAASIRLSGGVTLLSIRFPSVVLSAITLLCVAGISKLLFNSRAALFSTAILATSYLFAVNAHDCLVDVSLTTFVAAALFGFLLDSRRAGYPRWGILFGLATAGGILAKGLVGLALPVAITIPFWILAAERPLVRCSVRAAALALPLAAISAWAAVVYLNGSPGAVHEALWDQQFGRFLGFGAREYSHHRKPLYFYLVEMPGMLFPWIVSIPAAVGFAWRDRPTNLPETSMKRHLRMLFVGLAMGVLLLSIAGTKRTVYFLPLVPVVATLVGGFFDGHLRIRSPKPGTWVWAQFLPLAISAAAIPLVPALSDGRLNIVECFVAGAAVVLCVSIGFASRRDTRHLVTASLAIAVGSLLVMDLFSLRRIDRDGDAREFFARVEKRLSAGGSIHTWNLNEDVLGRACLTLRRRPTAQSDEQRLVRALAEPGAFLLAETRSILRAQRARRIRLEAVETGRAGTRALTLYRLRQEESSDGKDR